MTKHFMNTNKEKILVRFYESGMCYVYKHGIKGWIVKVDETHLYEYLSNGGFFEIGVTRKEKQRRQGQLELI